MVDLTLNVSVPALKVAAGILGASLSELIVGGVVIVGSLYLVYKIAEAINGSVEQTDEDTYVIEETDVTEIPVE